MKRYYVKWKIENVSYDFECDNDIKELWKEGTQLVKNGRNGHYKCRYIVRDNMTGEKLFYLYSRLSVNGSWVAKVNAVGRYGRHHQGMYL